MAARGCRSFLDYAHGLIQPQQHAQTDLFVAIATTDVDSLDFASEECVLAACAYATTPWSMNTAVRAAFMASVCVVAFRFEV